MIETFARSCFPCTADDNLIHLACAQFEVTVFILIRIYLKQFILTWTTVEENEGHYLIGLLSKRNTKKAEHTIYAD